MTPPIRSQAEQWLKRWDWVSPRVSYAIAEAVPIIQTLLDALAARDPGLPPSDALLCEGCDASKQQCDEWRRQGKACCPDCKHRHRIEGRCTACAKTPLPCLLSHRGRMLEGDPRLPQQEQPSVSQEHETHATVLEGIAEGMRSYGGTEDEQAACLAGAKALRHPADPPARLPEEQ